MSPPSVPSPVTAPSSRFVSSSSSGLDAKETTPVNTSSDSDKTPQRTNTRPQTSLPTTATTLAPEPTSAALLNSTSSSLYGNSGMYGGGMGGLGSMGGLGGMGGGMYGMGGMNGGSMYNPMMMGAGSLGMLGGPLNTLNQVLFSVQTVVFSLGQAVQIIGMNTQAIKQLFESLTGMFDHVVATIQELQALEQQKREHMTEQELKRKRRLQLLRWTLATAVSYAVYKLLRRVMSRRGPQPQLQAGSSYYPSSNNSYSGGGVGGYSGGYSSSPYSSASPYNSGPYGPSSAMMPYQSGQYGGYGGGGSY